MKISMIVAKCAHNNAIGYKGEIPWKIKGEQKRFKDITMGHPIVMGRKTHDSIGRVLPGRTNMVLTKQEEYCPFGNANIWYTVTNLLDACARYKYTKIFIIGGEQIYKQFLPLADEIFVTDVYKWVTGDAYFPFISEKYFRLLDHQIIHHGDNIHYVYKKYVKIVA